VSVSRLPPAEQDDEDRVLRATLAYAPACGRVPPFGADYIVACAAFRRAVRARLVREVAEGLPADVAGALLLVAIRFAVADREPGPAASRVEHAAWAPLDSTVRALRPGGPGDAA
jgi:hypothetical protein